MGNKGQNSQSHPPLQFWRRLRHRAINPSHFWRIGTAWEQSTMEPGLTLQEYQSQPKVKICGSDQFAHVTTGCGTRSRFKVGIRHHRPKISKPLSTATHLGILNQIAPKVELLTRVQPLELGIIIEECQSYLKARICLASSCINNY